MTKSAAYPRGFAKKIFQEHSAFKRESGIINEWDQKLILCHPLLTVYFLWYYSLLTYAMRAILTNRVRVSGFVILLVFEIIAYIVLSNVSGTPARPHCVAPP